MATAKWSAEQRDRRRARDFASSLRRRWGLEVEEYERLLDHQAGRCAICGNRPGKRRLAVDHCHRTGALRGLLCHRCNHELLGAAHDGVEILKRAIAYLRRPPAQDLWPGRTPP